MNPLRRRIQTAMQSGGGAAAAFDPTTVSGMAAWWAARKESFANNDPVGTATDWTVNGLSLTQATASKKPLFLTGQKNGLPAFSADGVDDFFSGGDILDIGTGSIHFFFVAKYDSVASDAVMMAKSKAGGHPSRYSGVDVVSSQWYSLLEPTSGGALNLNTGTANTSWHLFEFVVDRPLTKVAMWLDGVEIASSSAVPAGDINSTFRFLLFAYNDGTDTGETGFMPGKIAEVWCWQRVLTAGERDTLRIGAANLYNIPVYTSQFQPNQIAGLKLWLDASQITGLNDGDAVATWSDASGNALNFTQATASKRPLYKTGIQNGLPGVLADGVDDIMESASVNWSAYDKATLFCVYKNPTATADEIIYERSADVNANNGAWILFNNAANVISAAKTPTGVAYSSVTNAFANGVVVTKIDLALASNALTAKLNGADFSGRAYDGNGGNFGNYANYLFERSGGGVAPMNGYILEMGVYMGEIGDAARAQLTTYLRNKWGY